MYKILFTLILPIYLSAFGLGDLLPEKVKTIGKQTPIDISLYAKNSSTKCSLIIKNISNPYKKDISKKLPNLKIMPGRYFRKDIKNILKGEYEFEYSWYKNGKFIDSGIKSIRIFAYHDTSLKLHKKVKLTFDSLTPKECR